MGVMAKPKNPDQYFGGRMLEMAQAIRANDLARLRQWAVGQNLIATTRCTLSR